jgi:peptidoglycan-associated lipoprotein
MNCTSRDATYTYGLFHKHYHCLGRAGASGLCSARIFLIKQYILPLITVLLIAVFMSGCANKTLPITSKETIETTPSSSKIKELIIPEKPQESLNIDMSVLGPLPSLKEEIMVIEDSLIFFDFDKYTLKPWSLEVLNRIASFLKANPSITIQIVGNCDERGTVEYNLALGERRAKAAMDYIVSLGIEKERISIISYGKEKPIDPGHTEEAWVRNRNDKFVVINR